MLDDETLIRAPHAVTKTRVDGRTRTRIDDPRVSVTMQAEGAALAFFFDPENAFAGNAQLLEIRILPPQGGSFEPWRLMPDMPLQLQYARASLAGRDGDVSAALQAMRKVNAPRRGLKDDFLRLVARAYTSLVDEGEPYPVKTLAKMQHADISTASRWISAARRRGFLSTEEDR